jgi:hypothetical protein
MAVIMAAVISPRFQRIFMKSLPFWHGMDRWLVRLGQQRRILAASMSRKTKSYFMMRNLCGAH